MKHLTVFLSLVYTALSFAGSADQDMIVDMTRELFKESKVNLIEVSSLKLLEKSLWKCAKYDARRDRISDYYDYGHTLKLSLEKNKIFNDGNIKTGTFAMAKNYAVARVGDKVTSLKMLDTQTLILEESTTTGASKTHHSLIAKNLNVLNYYYCKN